MKDFFKRYSYQSMHLFLNQVAIGLFGMVLALAAGMADSVPLRIVTSIFAILFYLFLQFAAGWRVGAEDRVSIDLGKRKKDIFVPVKKKPSEQRQMQNWVQLQTSGICLQK